MTTRCLARTAFALLLLACAQAYAGPGARDPDAYFFTESFGDFHEELQTARAQGKKGIMIFFEQEGCPYCAWMRDTVLNQPPVQDWYRERFLNFTLDIHGATEVTDFQGRAMTAKDFANNYRVRATPTILFFDLAGRRTVRFTGATRDLPEFMLLGQFVDRGAYRNTDFSHYRRRGVELMKTTLQRVQ